MKSLVAVGAVVLLFHQVMANSDLVAKASNTFANNLYQKVAKEPGNVLVCPLSLHVALGLVLQGAGSNTSSQLASVLGFSAANAANTKDSYKALLTGIQDNTLKIATKLYPSSGYKLSSSYVSLAQDYFLSGVEGVDYSEPVKAAGKINKYVEEHTNNKIHDLISPDSISDLTKLIIINAIHFQATWQKTFTTAYDDFFKVSPGEKVMTKMMSMTDYFHYKEDPALDAKVLKMDYTDGGYSMLFILPNKEDGLPALEAKLENTELISLLKDLKETKVEVTIPKFKLEKTIKLKDILIDMGITDLFTSRADLNGIANGDKLYVSDVIQKTFINVHENGTEAAAATGIYLELLSASFDTVMFSARWPFHFTLINTKRPRKRLFDGRLVNPSQGRTPSRESDRVSQTHQVGVEVSEKPLENNENIMNLDQETDQSFKPDGVNNLGTSIQTTNTPLTVHTNKSHKQNKNNLFQIQHAIIGIDQRISEDHDQFDNQEYSRRKSSQHSQNHNTNKKGTNNFVQTRNGTTGINQRQSEDNKQFDNEENSRLKSSQQSQNHNTNKKGTKNVVQTRNGTTGIDQRQSEDNKQFDNEENSRKKSSQQSQNHNTNKKTATNSYCALLLCSIPDTLQRQQDTTRTDHQESEDQKGFNNQEYIAKKSSQQPQSYNTNKKNTKILIPAQKAGSNLEQFDSKDYQKSNENSFTGQKQSQQPRPILVAGLAQSGSIFSQWSPSIVQDPNPYQQIRYQQPYLFPTYRYTL